MNYVLAILGMAAVTLAVKAGIFVLGDRVRFPEWLREALSFVPVTVLTAIIVPMTLAPHGNGLELTWRNPQLVAALVAIAVCAATRHQLLTIGAGLAVFFAWQLGGRALWLVPSAFIGVMALGGAIGMLGAGLPFVETGIALSLIGLGVSLLSDLTYMWIDPRIDFESREL